MNRPDIAEVRFAADHAARIIGDVSGTFSLLLDELADGHADPDPDTIARWFSTVAWLKGRIEAERAALLAAMNWEKAQS